MNILIAAQEISKRDDANKSQPKLRLSTVPALLLQCEQGEFMWEVSSNDVPNKCLGIKASKPIQRCM